MSKKINILILLIITIIGIVYSYDLSKSFIENFRETQTHSYQGGTGQIRSSDEFLVDGCGSGTVYDKLWDLCWEKDGSSHYNWNSAVSHCDGLTLGGSSDWRLPTVKELNTLIYDNGQGATYSKLNSIGFQNIKNSYYWSSELYSSSSAYVVAFNYGRSSNYGISNSYYVLCIRNSN